VVLTHFSCSFETDSIGNKGGWMKCCEASGRLTVEQVPGAVCCVEVLEKHGLKKSTLSHDVTISNAGGSGRLECNDARKETKGFQLGGILHRDTEEPTKPLNGKIKRTKTVLDVFMRNWDINLTSHVSNNALLRRLC
jgi:hypothetical protein